MGGLEYGTFKKMMLQISNKTRSEVMTLQKKKLQNTEALLLPPWLLLMVPAHVKKN